MSDLVEQLRAKIAESKQRPPAPVEEPSEEVLREKALMDDDSVWDKCYFGGPSRSILPKTTAMMGRTII